MKRMNDLEYLKLGKFQRFIYDLKMFFCSIPGWLAGLFIGLWGVIKDFAIYIKDEFVDIGRTFKNGNWEGTEFLKLSSPKLTIHLSQSFKMENNLNAHQLENG